MARKQYLEPAKLGELFSYDRESGILVWRERTSAWFKDGYRTAQGEANNWNVRYAGKVAGSVAPVGYRYVTLPGGGRVPEHRVIWAMTKGYWPDTIDHINGDKLDNRLTNLRNCDQRTNMRNAGMWSHNTSGFTGVHFEKRSRRWMAYIKIDGVNKFLGYFNGLCDALTVRRDAETRYNFTARHGV